MKKIIALLTFCFLTLQTQTYGVGMRLDDPSYAPVMGKYVGTLEDGGECTLELRRSTADYALAEALINSTKKTYTLVVGGRSNPRNLYGGGKNLLPSVGIVVPFFFHYISVDIDDNNNPISYDYFDNASCPTRMLFRKDVKCINLKKID